MKESKYVVILTLTLILALILRLPNLIDKEQGTDEKLSIRNANTFKNISAIKNINENMPNEVNPPLFFVLLGIALLVFDSAITLKILVLIIAILSIIIFYLLSRKIFNRNLSIITTFLYSINPMHIVLSQHIRSYILIFLLFNSSLYFLYKFLFEKDSKSLVYLTVVYITSIYTHYYSGLFIAGGGITVLFFYFLNKKIKLTHYIISNIIILILSIPAFILLKLQIQRLYEDITRSTITPIIIFYPLHKLSIMIDVSTTLTNFPYLIITPVMLIILLLYGSYKLFKDNKEKFTFIISNFLTPYAILSITGLIWPTHSFRYLTFLLPLYTILFSYGLFNIKNKTLKFILLTLIIISWAIVIVYYYRISTIYHWPQHIAI